MSHRELIVSAGVLYAIRPVGYKRNHWRVIGMARCRRCEAREVHDDGITVFKMNGDFYHVDCSLHLGGYAVPGRDIPGCLR